MGNSAAEEVTVRGSVRLAGARSALQAGPEDLVFQAVKEILASQPGRPKPVIDHGPADPFPRSPKPAPRRQSDVAAGNHGGR